MRLSSLTLTNIRQFARRTFEFQPGFNLLVGENGAGKTTILRSLLAVVGEDRQISRRPRLGDDDIRLHESRAEITAKVYLSSNNIKEFHFQKQLWGRSERAPSQTGRPLILLYASNEATCSAMKVKQAKRIQASKADNLLRDEVFLYETQREMSLLRQQEDVGEHRFGNSRSVRDFVGRVLSTFSHDFGDFYWRFEPYDCSLFLPDRAEKKSPVDVELQKRAKSFAMRFFHEGRSRRQKMPIDWPDETEVVLTPGSGRYGDRLPSLLDIWESMKLSPKEQRVLQACSLEVKLTPRIMIRREIGLLSLSQLSDGEQRLFSLFVDIARQLLVRDSSDRIGAGEAIVLIDEIDVHLHPKWQRNIVPALEDLFPDCQFIATTHSPFVIQATNRQKVISIDLADPIPIMDGGNSIEDIAENIQGVSVPQRSVRAENLSAAAEQYFKLLNHMESHTDSPKSAELFAAEQLYRATSEAFTSDPGMHAFIKVQSMKRKSQ